MNTPFTLKGLKAYFLVVLVITPLVLRMISVDDYVYSYTGTRFIAAFQVLANDVIIYAAILLLFYISYLSRIAHAASIAARGVALIILSLYVVDVFVISNFNTHLVIGDVIKYGSYALKYILQIYGWKLALLPIAAIIVIALVLPYTLTRYKIRSNAIHGFFIVAILGLICISSFAAAGNDRYVHSWVYRNFVEHNLTVLSEARAYSDEFLGNFTFEEDRHCYSAAPRKPNIIILMVESLSSYQSDCFSGIRNWTPNLDTIARHNISYTDFYANGFTTEDAEISLLTGQLPIYPPSSYANGGGQSFKGFYGVEESLPHILKNQGYWTEFLTTADLEFADTGNWAKSIGFDYIEGHDHPYYEGWHRFHFKAAPDEALYNRVLDRVEYNRNNRFFIFIKTVSTHHPFIDPETMEKSEARAFQYADRQLGFFYRRLIDLDYFDEGILVIVGDHHAMVPLKNEEIGRFGSLRAPSKVPMVVSYGDRSHSVEDGQYQQTDIYNGLKGIVSNVRCYSDWTGSIFDGETAKYIVHRRGDNRHIISIFSETENSLFMLNGDYSSITTEAPVDEAIRELITRKLNALRIPRNTTTSAHRGGRFSR